MKLKNYCPRPMREVEYYGVSISIPADHEWVATDADGEIYSYSDKPEYSEDTMIWGSDFLDSECPFAVAVPSAPKTRQTACAITLRRPHELHILVSLVAICLGLFAIAHHIAKRPQD